jgi:plastocyanin
MSSTKGSPVRKLVLVSLASLVLVAAALAPAAVAAPANAVRIAAVSSGLRYDTKTLRARAGRITIVFTNRSTLHHNVRIELGENELGGTKTIGHGTTTAVVTLKKGTYHFYCSVPGHEDAGMSGKLVVS